MNLLSHSSTLEHSARATFYASLMLATMTKFKAGRIYLLSEESQPVIGGLLDAFENSFKGETSLEAGTMALIALQRLSVEPKAAVALLKLGAVSRIATVVASSVGGDRTGELFFLLKTMIDSGDQAEAASLEAHPDSKSPLKRENRWSEFSAWEEVRTHCISYASSLFLNVSGCGSAEWSGAYATGAEKEGGESGDNAVNMMLAIAKTADREHVQETLMSAAFAYVIDPAARAACRAAGTEHAIGACLEGDGGGIDAHMLTCLMNRVLVEGVVEVQGEGGGEAEGEDEDKYETLDEDVNLEFQSTIEAEEKIHSAIEGVESGELPDGWEEGVEATTGLRYFFKKDGSSSSWVLPSRSDAILEAFYLTKNT